LLIAVALIGTFAMGLRELCTNQSAERTKDPAMTITSSIALRRIPEAIIELACKSHGSRWV
jgi:hypothetical protein